MGQREHFDKLWLVREELLAPHDLILQAKALVLCALPYKRTKEIRVTRKARVGKRAWVSVTFAAVGDGAVLPYGADRAVLGWIQTRAFKNGFVEYDTLKEFFTDFHLNDSGANYQRFRQRVERLTHLAVSIEGQDEETGVVENLMPVKRAFFPKTSREARHRVKEEEAGQLLMVPQRYGFQLDPDFWTYLRTNPVPLPLPLMRLFHNKPKGWDFAQFCLWRCYAARSETMIPWEPFQAQLGSTDKNPKQLRYTLRRYLEQMKVVYPDLPAEFEMDGRGLRVSHWRPPKLEG